MKEALVLTALKAGSAHSSCYDDVTDQKRNTL
jgi:hypothetical protein